MDGSRYEIQGPKMNPVSAVCFRIWDSEEEDWVHSPGHGYAWEFLTKESAQEQINLRERGMA